MRTRMRRPFMVLCAVFALVLSGGLGVHGSVPDGMQKAARQVRATRPNLNPDVAVENFSVSKTSVNDDDSVRVSFKVKNLGNTHIKEVSYMVFMGELYLLVIRPHFQFDAGVFRDIPIGGQRNYNKTFPIPWNIDTSKIKHIAVFLDRDNRLKEQNFWENNFGVERFTVTVRRLPDLAVTRLQFGRRPFPAEGGAVTVSFTIKNIGSRASLPCTYEAVGSARFTRSGQTSVGTQRIYSTWEEQKTYIRPIRALGPNEAMSGYLRFPVPGSANNYKVHLWADYQNVVPEPDERNNKKETTKE